MFNQYIVLFIDLIMERKLALYSLSLSICELHVVFQKQNYFFIHQKLPGIQVGNGGVYDRTRPSGEREKRPADSHTEGKDQRR